MKVRSPSQRVRSRIRVSAVAGATLLAAAPLLAQQAPARLGSEIQWLQQEDVVVTNDRTPRRIDSIPANVTVITAEQIERMGARQVPDVLRYYAGVDVHDFFGNSRQARVDVRGQGINADSSVLVLVDGRRINGVTLFNTDWTTIPLERVARIEVVRGGNSVLYGTQAVGGVINIITKRGTIEQQLHTGLDLGSWGYFKPYANLSGSTLLLDGSLTYHLNASRVVSEGYRDNSYLRLNTQGASINYEKGRFALDASIGHKEDKYGQPGGLIGNRPPRSAANPTDRAESEDTYLHLIPSLRITPGDRVQLVIDTRKTDQTSVTSFGGLPSAMDDAVRQSLVSAQYIGQQQFAGLRNRLTVGLDRLRSKLDRRSTFGSPQNASTARAAYISDTISLLEDVLHVDAGYRKESFDYEISQPATQGDVGAHAARLGLTWNYREGSKAFIGFDRSYRVQLLDEIGQPVILRPQVARQVQVGASHRFGKGTELRGALYEIRTRDEIVLDPDTFSNVNWPNTRRRGIELEGNAAITDRLSAFAAFSRSNSTTEAGPYAGRQIPLTTRSKGALGATFVPMPAWTVDARYRWVSGKKMDFDFANQGSWKDRFHVADLGVTYKDRRFTVAAGVLNVTNQKFSEVGIFLGPFGNSLFPLPERTFYLNLAFTNIF